MQVGIKPAQYLIVAILLVNINKIYAIDYYTQLNTINLQTFIDNEIKNKDIKNAHLSGIPLTFQCQGFNSDQPISYVAGKINSNIGAPNLPTNGIFEAGSISKSFISVVALQLEAEGYFGNKGLNSTIGEILNSPPPYWNYKWNTITLQELLNMTIGISDSDPTDSKNIILKYIQDPYQYFSIDDLIKAVADKELLFKPGHGWHYSNTNYVIMAKIIEAITGMSIQAQVNTRIIKPLHLSHTYYIEHLAEDEITTIEQKLLISGYAYLEESQYKSKYIYPGADIKNYSLSWAQVAGSIITNTPELNIYARSLFNGRLLNQEQINELTNLVAEADNSKYRAGEHISKLDSVTTKGYGLGVEAMLLTAPNKVSDIVYEHGGSTMGFGAVWLYDSNYFASITTSVNSTDEPTQKIMVDVINQSLNKVYNDCIFK